MSKGLTQTIISTSVFCQDFPKDFDKAKSKNGLKTIYPLDNISPSNSVTNCVPGEKKSNKKSCIVTPSLIKEGSDDSYISGLSHIKLSETCRIGYEKSGVTPIKEEESEEEEKKIKETPSQFSIPVNLFSKLKTVSSRIQYIDDPLERLKALKNPYDSIPSDHSQLCYIKNKALFENNNVNNCSKLEMKELFEINENDKSKNKRIAVNNGDTPNDTETGSQGDKKINIFNMGNPYEKTIKENKEKNKPLISLLDTNDYSAYHLIDLNFKEIEKYLPSLPMVPREPKEKRQIKKLDLLCDNKYSIIPLLEDNTYPFMPVISDIDISRKIQAEFSQISLSKEEFNLKQQSLINLMINNTNKVNNIIGNLAALKCLESLVVKPNQSSYSSSMAELSSDIETTRSVFCDGNGFYRAMAFSIIDHCVLKKSSIKLARIAFGISSIKNTPFQLNDTPYDKVTLLLIIKILLEYMSDHSYALAYQLFLKAFTTESSFEFGLIKFIKMSLAEYIKANADKFDVTLLKKQISSEYFNIDNTFNSNQYIINNVLVMKKEPDSFLITITPKALEIDMKFYYIEPEKLIKRTFLCNGETIDDDSFIHIISLLSRYEIGYNQGMNLIVNNSCAQETEDLNQNKLVQCNRKSICKNCKAKNNEVIIPSSKNAILCKVCLLELINQSAKKEIMRLMDDNYQHFEFFCQPIIISKHPLTYIYDEDLHALMNMTIPQYMKYLIAHICVLCNKVLEGNDEFVRLQCKCTFCLECIREKVKTDTNNRIILNEYELYKDKEKKIKPQCFCQREYDIENLSSVIFRKKINEYHHQAQLRKIEVMNLICCICLKEKANKIILIIPGLIGNKSHLICNECRMHYNSMLKRGSLRNNHILNTSESETIIVQMPSSNRGLKSVTSNQASFNCVFCNETHEYSSKSFPNSKREVCCNDNSCLVV